MLFLTINLLNQKIIVGVLVLQALARRSTAHQFNPEPVESTTMPSITIEEHSASLWEDDRS